jgi:hypothetical protein
MNHLALNNIARMNILLKSKVQNSCVCGLISVLAQCLYLLWLSMNELGEAHVGKKSTINLKWDTPQMPPNPGGGKL